ncbi:GTP-binding protein [Thioalkalivibrio sp. ALR17-21]|uniref:CobW family GTP-binding protein n=1 Tax=Thioalkalivibrio sp. ALR17-21 TaxID=1269813 RepID=UPI000421AE5C|nr:GTP-binding protein [Thioalkalivibrio sp. ALR17-21]
MSRTEPAHRDIPVNLVTGFLGVGKTTTIRALLEQRPQDERWAVLVNEFGEIGVDGGLLADTGVRTEEIPGGCLCCVSAQMFTVGLNRLIRQQRPDRILIEPTGLGHPAEIIRTLTAPPYDTALDLRATVTVMDARHLASPRHREHPNWNDQISVADVLIANKADAWSEADREALHAFVAGLPAPRPRVIETREGHIDAALLDAARLEHGGALFPEARAFLAATADTGHDHDHEHHHEHEYGADSDPGDWVVIDNRGDGFVGRSWRFPASTVFDHAALETLVQEQDADRLKGVLQTERGWQQINRVERDGGLEALAAPPKTTPPRLELIRAESGDRGGRKELEALNAVDRALRRAARLPADDD